MSALSVKDECPISGCDTPNNMTAITDCYISSGAGYGRPLVYASKTGHVHLHGVVVTTYFEMTVRAAVRRLYLRVRIRVTDWLRS